MFLLDKFYLRSVSIGEFQVDISTLWKSRLEHVIFLLLIHDYLDAFLT
uniref:Uncharacterized protein n=1 Tax=Arundo donax TaxID=35708 RepID=A0A0A9HI80_ARUDO